MPSPQKRKSQALFKNSRKSAASAEKRREATGAYSPDGNAEKRDLFLYGLYDPREVYVSPCSLSTENSGGVPSGTVINKIALVNLPDPDDDKPQKW